MRKANGLDRETYLASWSVFNDYVKAVSVNRHRSFQPTTWLFKNRIRSRVPMWAPVDLVLEAAEFTDGLLKDWAAAWTMKAHHRTRYRQAERGPVSCMW
jgi:hypothetical protein